MAQDYILRLIQQIGAMLAAIIAKRSQGQLAEASQEVDAACLSTVGLPLDRVKGFSPDELAEQLQMSGALRYPRAVMLAELLMQDAEILESTDEPEQALASYIHAFCLLVDSIEFLSSEERAVYESRLEVIAGKLDHLPPNPYTTQKLLGYRTYKKAAPEPPPATAVLESSE